MPPSFQLSQVSTTPAEVELRLGVDDKAITIVSAHIRGPFCEYASTLPATVPFRRNHKKTECFKATVPDPCYWTPLMPHIYRVEVQYRRDEVQTVETARFERGLCRCEIRGNALFIDGERTIIRGIGWRDFVNEPAWNELRATRTSLVASEWNEDFVEKCSKHGVPLFLNGNDVQFIKDCDVHKFPAFFGSIATKSISDANRGNESKYQARVTLATQSPNSSNRPNQLVFAVLDQENASFTDWTEKRKACDVLQAEVVSIGEFAGYVVL